MSTPNDTLSADQAEGGADVSPLRALGVPVADVRQDATRYFDVHHSANDRASTRSSQRVPMHRLVWIATRRTCGRWLSATIASR